jgi:hypothetical protein
MSIENRLAISEADLGRQIIVSETATVNSFSGRHFTTYPRNAGRRSMQQVSTGLFESKGSILTAGGAAERWGLSRSLIYDLCGQGVIRHTRHGRPGKRGTIRITEAAMVEYMVSCERGPEPADDECNLKHITLQGEKRKSSQSEKSRNHATTARP